MGVLKNLTKMLLDCPKILVIFLANEYTRALGVDSRLTPAQNPDDEW